MKYEFVNARLSKDKRALFNAEVLHSIAEGAIEANEVFNKYTGIGGLHGLKYVDFDSFYEYTEAKKEIELGQFFTPPELCGMVVQSLKPQADFKICDITCGSGNFFNYLPTQSNLYGCEIQPDAFKVARFLYPDANIVQGDFVSVKFGAMFDLFIGNPPFNLRIPMEQAQPPHTALSQMIFMRKAADMLKPGRLLCFLAPKSFLQDEYTNRTNRGFVNEHFNFICQAEIDRKWFDVDIDIKVMYFQRLFRGLAGTGYHNDYVDFDPEAIYLQYVKPTYDSMKDNARIRLDHMRAAMEIEKFIHYENGVVVTPVQQELFKKYMFHIRTQHDLRKKHYEKAKEKLKELETQTKPQEMGYADWEKNKLKPEEVVRQLAKWIRNQYKPGPRKMLKLVKTRYSIKYKSYDRSLKDQEKEMNINDIILKDKPYKGRFDKMLNNKKREYKLQQTPFHQLERSPELDRFLRDFELRENGADSFELFSDDPDTIRLNEKQFHDCGLAFQKRYAILAWQMGCVDAETEYLTPIGWKKITDYKKGMVGQFNLEKQTLEFVKPFRYIKAPCDFMYHFHHKYGLDQMLSPEHKILFSNKRGRQWATKTAQELYEQVQRNVRMVSGVRLPTIFNYNGGTGIELTNEQLRVQVAFIADGHIPNKSSRCRINIKKERKKERLRLLLQKAAIEFSEYPKETGYSEFYFHPPLRIKEYDARFYNCSKDQLETIFDEVYLWDGSINAKGGKSFSSTNKNSADFIQFCNAALGHNSVVRIDERPNRENYKTCYDVGVRRVDSGFLSVTKSSVSIATPADGFKYCFEVPSGYLILRRNGKIFITGNSGKSIAGMAWVQLQRPRVHNVFITAPSLAIQLTWKVRLKKYGFGFIEVKKIKDFAKIKKGQIVLMSFDGVRILRKYLRDYIKKVVAYKIALLVDESDELSNPGSSRTRAMNMCFKKARYKLLTTGTTTRNNVNELYPQLELLYNNSINFLCWSEFSHRPDKDNVIQEVVNDWWGKPFPAWRGHALFKYCHCPQRTTVFGIKQDTQDIYNANKLKDLIDKTIITRTFDDVVGKRIYKIKTHHVVQGAEEKRLYGVIINEFEAIVNTYFSASGSARKEALLKMIRQITLLIQSTSIPHTFPHYEGDQKPMKFYHIARMIKDWPNEKVAIGTVLVEAAEEYYRFLGAQFEGNREIFYIDGSRSFAQRKKIIADFQATGNGILISTQQSLKSSVDIETCNKCIIESLQWNLPKISQYYFRFIRYNSKEEKEIHFVTYSNSIENNILALLMSKEKLNEFIKTTELQTRADIMNDYDVDTSILDQIITKEYDHEGKLRLRWGQQKIVR